MVDFSACTQAQQQASMEAQNLIADQVRAQTGSTSNIATTFLLDCGALALTAAP